MRGCLRCVFRRVLGVCVGRVCGRVYGRLGRRGWGCGLEKVSLAALLSGYLGKSGHLPRFRLQGMRK